MTKRLLRARVAAGMLAAVAVFGTVIVPATAAVADDYSTWSDVEKARKSESATKAAIKRIQAQLVQLAADVERTQAELKAKTARWREVDALFRAKQSETTTLLAQAEEAEALAVESEQRASTWAAQVVRVGGSDPTLNLFIQADNASQILSAIGVATRVSSQAQSVYEQAEQQKNTATALTAQAEAARGELEKLEGEAEVAMAEAQAASEAATRALIAQQEHKAELEQQLIVLTANRKATEADYRAGVKARLQAQLNALGINWAKVSDSGWVRPSAGVITAVFGYSAYYGGTHSGVDLGASCGSSILAAHEGTVTFAGWNSGGYGYLTIIDHGGGLVTYYGHQKTGGILVKVGQHVDVGQRIGLVGTTGKSTGCHLHFEMRANGTRIDPVKVLAANGIYL